MNKTKRLRWLWMLPVLLLTTALAASQLNVDAIWFDEWITYYISGGGDFEPRPLPDLIRLAAEDNSWPPAFFLLLAGWDKVSGGVYYLDRILALFIGLLTVSLIYRLGRQLFSNSTGLVAALLLGTLAFFLFYMHEIRGYTLYVFFPTLSAWLYCLIQDPRYARRTLRWGFAISIAITLYTHYVASAFVLSIGLYHVLLNRPPNLVLFRRDDEQLDPAQERWITTLKLWFNGSLFFSLWVAVTIISFLNESLTQRSLDTLTLMRSMVYGFSNNLWWLALAALLLSLVLWRNRRVQFLWIWVLTVLAVSIIGNIWANFLFHPRHIMGLLPAFIMLIAAAIMHINRYNRAAAWLLVGIWVGAGIIHATSPDFMNAIPRHVSAVPLPAMQSIVEMTEQCVAEDDAVVLALDTANDVWIHDLPVEYYLPQAGYRFTHLGLLVTDEVDNRSRLLPEALQGAPYAERIAYLAESAARVWVFSLPDLPVQDELLRLNSFLRDAGYRTQQEVINHTDLLVVVYANANHADDEPLDCAV